MLDLFGELDIVTMSKFEAALDALIASKPGHAIFDLSGATFICGRDTRRWVAPALKWIASRSARRAVLHRRFCASLDTTD